MNFDTLHTDLEESYSEIDSLTVIAEKTESRRFDNPEQEDGKELAIPEEQE